MARQTQKIQEIPEASPQATAETMPQSAELKTHRARAVPTRPRLASETVETPETSERPETPKSAETEAQAFDVWESMTNTEALDALAKMNRTMLDSMATLQREVMEFGNARLNQDLEHQETLSQCTNLQDAMQAHSDFAQQAMQHYADEMAKLLSLSAKVSRDCWSPFEDATRAAFDTIKPR